MIDGAVVEKGWECGIPTPLHERVTELIHAAERANEVRHRTRSRNSNVCNHRPSGDPSV